MAGCTILSMCLATEDKTKSHPWEKAASAQSDRYAVGPSTERLDLGAGAPPQGDRRLQGVDPRQLGLRPFRAAFEMLTGETARACSPAAHRHQGSMVRIAVLLALIGGSLAVGPAYASLAIFRKSKSGAAAAPCRRAQRLISRRSRLRSVERRPVRASAVRWAAASGIQAQPLPPPPGASAAPPPTPRPGVAPQLQPAGLTRNRPLQRRSRPALPRRSWPIRRHRSRPTLR